MKLSLSPVQRMHRLKLPFKFHQEQFAWKGLLLRENASGAREKDLDSLHQIVQSISNMLPSQYVRSMILIMIFFIMSGYFYCTIALKMGTKGAPGYSKI